MCAPESYHNEHRPPIEEALALEGKATVADAMRALEEKGYFTPKPRPWCLGFCECGRGHRSYAILDHFGDLVMEAPDKATAELIIAAVNVYAP